jgi:iron(III) transport system ATP-binding protein
MSVTIRIEHAEKRYGSNTIIRDLSLEIRQGEFFTLLGPSGCGKTTLLRMIAGFNSIEGGSFFFDDRLINHIDPAKRNIGMVFQNYAVFPHLTVRQNVEFGLKARKYSGDRIKKLVDRMLDLMKIAEYAGRLPERLSGGQQQRVALARALVIEPDVLLMDEPLSNLDAKLRVEMRDAIKEIQHQFGITTVYVTHDQEEAMAVSDRIAVMKDGNIHQIGSPKELYQRPYDLFVSTFIGHTNILPAVLEMRGGVPFIVFSNGVSIPMTEVAEEHKKDQAVSVSIRPEEFVITDDGFMGAVVERSVFLGLNTYYFVTLETGEHAEIIQESTVDRMIPNKSEIRLGVKQEKINVFTKDGSGNILWKP